MALDDGKFDLGSGLGEQRHVQFVSDFLGSLHIWFGAPSWLRCPTVGIMFFLTLFPFMLVCLSSAEGMRSRVIDVSYGIRQV